MEGLGCVPHGAAGAAGEPAHQDLLNVQFPGQPWTCGHAVPDNRLCTASILYWLVADMLPCQCCHAESQGLLCTQHLFMIGAVCHALPMQVGPKALLCRRALRALALNPTVLLGNDLGLPNKKRLRFHDSSSERAGLSAG
jgi:hypothetical protein